MGRNKSIQENWQDELARLRPYEPAPTIEGREGQLTNLAINLTEYHMLTNTASSAEICQYLKLGTSMNLLEAEKLRLENALTDRKISVLEAAAESELQNAEVIAALKRCRGEDDGVG